MCTPTAGMIITGVSTIGNMYAAQQQGKAQQAMYNYQAQVAQNNANQAQQQAESNAVAGAQQAKQVLQKANMVKAAQTVAYSANNMDVGQGSPLDVLADTEALGQMDKANTLYNSANNTWAIQNQEQNYLSQANLDRTAANNAATAGRNGMWGALLTGASSLVNQYNNYSSTGAMGTSVKKKTKYTATMDDLQPTYGEVW